MNFPSNYSYLVKTYSLLSILYGGFSLLIILSIIMIFVSISNGVPFFSPLTQSTVGIKILDPQLRNVMNPGTDDAFLMMNEGKLLFRNPSLGINLLVGFLHMVYLANVLIIIILSRKLLMSIKEQRVFCIENVKRIRFIGFILIYVPLFHFLINAVLYYFYISKLSLDKVELSWRPSFNLEIIILGMFIVVLASVFQEGNKMKKEIELTV